MRILQFCVLTFIISCVAYILTGYSIFILGAIAELIPIFLLAPTFQKSVKTGGEPELIRVQVTPEVKPEIPKTYPVNMKEFCGACLGTGYVDSATETGLRNCFLCQGKGFTTVNIAQNADFD